MPIKSLHIENFRNIKELHICPEPGVNLIIGENAQGKTNLIETIFYFSTMKSFRAPKDEMLILRGEKQADFSEELNNGERDFNINITLRQGEKKKVTVNGLPPERLLDAVGILPAVLFTPDDLMLIKQGAQERRRLVDIPLCQMRPVYTDTLARYNKILRMKRSLLKEENSGKDSSLLEVYNHRMAELGATIIRYRGRYIEELSRKASDIHRAISGEKENLRLKYKTVSVIEDYRAEEENRIRLENRLRELAPNELATESCLSGIHADDIQILIDDLPARGYASQGQCRSVALSLKLAEREILREETGILPVLLLDDVLSELDEARRNYILHHIPSGQIFITCCESLPFSENNNAAFYRMEKGNCISFRPSAGA